MNWRHFIAAVAFLTLLQPGISSAQGQSLSLVIKGGKQDLKNVPICVPLSVSKAVANQRIAFLKGDGLDLYGQLTTPGLVAEHIKPSGANTIRRDLHFVLPVVKAETEIKLECSIHALKVVFDGHRFKWDGKENEYAALAYWGGKADRSVLSYMYAPYDDSTPEARNKTYKVFHHLYAPDGKTLVTNGGHTDPFDDAKKLVYPHHRGLMYGFNKITYGDGKTADTWHCPPADLKKKRTENYVEHVKTLSEEAGPALGRHRVLIDWHGSRTDVFAKEERELTAYAVPGGTLVEFASLLTTTGGPVKLESDPQHAGFQFRAANEVAEKTAKQTYFLRVGGKGQPGETLNWDAKNPPEGTVDVPWKAMSFVLGTQRYTVAYLNHPDNPKPSHWSERDYGRFGCSFNWELSKDHPLLVHYRLWLQDGEMNAAQVEALATAFANPPTVTVR